MRFIFRFGRFHEDFTLPFTLSMPFTSLSLSPLYPFNLSILFSSLSLSPLYPFYPLYLLPFISIYIYIYLSLLSLPPIYIPPSTFFLSLSPSLSLLSIILFGASNGRFRPCFIKKREKIKVLIYIYL